MAAGKTKRIRVYAMRADIDALLRELLLSCRVEIDGQNNPSDIPEGAALTEIRALYNRLNTTVKFLDESKPVLLRLFKKRENRPLPVHNDPMLRERAMRTSERIEQMKYRLDFLSSEEAGIKADIASLAIWQQLDMPLETSDTRYTCVWFGVLPADGSAAALQKELSDRAEITIAGQNRKQTGILVMFHKDFAGEIGSILEKYAFTRVFFKNYTGTAAENMEKLRAKLAAVRAERIQIPAELKKLRSGEKEILLYRSSVVQDMMAEEMKKKMVETKMAVGFEGYIPASEVQSFEILMSRYRCAYDIADPSPDEKAKGNLKTKRRTETI